MRKAIAGLELKPSAALAHRMEVVESQLTAIEKIARLAGIQERSMMDYDLSHAMQTIRSAAKGMQQIGDAYRVESLGHFKHLAKLAEEDEPSA